MIPSKRSYPKDPIQVIPIQVIPIQVIPIQVIPIQVIPIQVILRYKWSFLNNPFQKIQSKSSDPKYPCQKILN